MRKDTVKRTILIAIAALCGMSGVAQASVAVIGNTSNTDTLNDEQVVRIFLGKTREFPSGKSAKAIDQNEGSPARQEFYSKVVKKDETALKAYWSNLIFTGKGTPPNAVGDDAAVKKFVQSNPDAIGYIDSKAVDSSIKVLLNVP